MAKQPFWLTFNPNTRVSNAKKSPWDTIELAGNVIPGETTLTDEGGIGIKVDKQNAKGTKGNDFVQTGFNFAKFSILVVLFDQQDWDAWQEFSTTITPTPTKGNVPPQTIYHPALASVGIDKCIIIDVGIPKRGKLPQTVEVTIKCEQWGKVTGATVTKPTDAASKDKALRTIVTQREGEWKQKYQKDNNTTLPADQIPPMPPSFARPGPD